MNVSSTVALANSKLSLPLVGFGVFQSAHAYESVVKALQCGYTHIDTARYYGNEEAVCKAVSDLNKGSHVFLTTKTLGAEHGTAKTRRAVEESAAIASKYGLKWDLFLLHDPTAGPQKRMEAWKVLIEKKKAGTLRAIGVSNFGVRHLEELKAAGLETPDVNQIELHPWFQQKEVVDYCIQHGIVVQAYCPLLRGQRLDDATVLAIAAKHRKSTAQILIRWSLQRGFVPLPKSDTPERIAANIDLYDFVLDPKDMATLDSLDLGEAGSCIMWHPMKSK